MDYKEETVHETTKMEREDISNGPAGYDDDSTEPFICNEGNSWTRHNGHSTDACKRAEAKCEETGVFKNAIISNSELKFNALQTLSNEQNCLNLHCSDSNCASILDKCKPTEICQKFINEPENDLIKDADHEFDDLDRGWAWVVLGASFCSFVLLGNGMYAVGILHSVLLERFQASVSLTSWAGALHTALYSLGGPLATAVIDRYSCRTAMVMSGVFFIVGYLATAFAPSIEVAIFTLGIVAGLGGGLAYTAAMVVVGFYFKKRLNLALGIANSGVGVGLFALAPVTEFAKEYYGSVGVFIFTAGIMSHIVSFGVASFPSKRERHIYMQRKLDATYAHNSAIGKRILKQIKPYLDVLCNKGIICLCVAYFLYSFGAYPVFLHLPTYITSEGFTAKEAALLLSISGFVCVPGRIISGTLADHIRGDFIYIGSVLIISVAMFIYPLTSDWFAGHVIFMVIFGTLFGVIYVMTTAMSLYFLDIKFLSAAIGLQFLFGGVGAALGPVLGGFIVDNGGSYHHSMLVSAFCLLLTAVFAASSMCFKKPTTEQITEVRYSPDGNKVKLYI